MPTTKLHCSNLGADALHAAIKSYLKKKESGATAPEKVLIDHDHEKEEVKAGSTCRCSYCNVENPADLPFCKTCGRELKIEA